MMTFFKTSLHVALIGVLILVTGCHPKSCVLEPTVCFSPPEKLIEKFPSSFDDLSANERSQDWGKEMVIANGFARESDFYRAITGFKRAEYLLPNDNEKKRRLLQIEYSIILCYYLGGRYQDAIEVFENSELVDVACSFPAFSNLLILLYDAYLKTDNEERAAAILSIIEKYSPDTARELRLSVALIDADIDTVIPLSEGCTSSGLVTTFLEDYALHAKSVQKAQWLNGLLPGAGYYYVGQKKAALTSFIINALFTAAAYQFFHRGYVAAGVITTSFELGWYIGGINGAGLAAKAYNEQLYGSGVKEVLIKGRLFPILMFETAF